MAVPLACVAQVDDGHGETDPGPDEEEVDADDMDFITACGSLIDMEIDGTTNIAWAYYFDERGVPDRRRGPFSPHVRIHSAVERPGRARPRLWRTGPHGFFELLELAGLSRSFLTGTRIAEPSPMRNQTWLYLLMGACTADDASLSMSADEQAATRVVSCPSQEVTANATPTNDLGRACTMIAGNLTVWGPGVTNLDGLAKITQVTGEVVIQETLVMSLSGLGALEQVGEGLFIWDNPSLTSLSGLSSLASVGDEFTIDGNHGLTILSGLPSGLSVGELQIRDSDGLTSLAGLPSDLTIDSLLVNDNDRMTSLVGIPRTAALTGLRIGYNDSLLYPRGLQHLESISGYLWIYHNPALVSLHGLDRLASTGRLVIAGNDALGDLANLANLETVGDGLYLTYNDGLTSCSMPSLKTVKGSFTIVENVSLPTEDAWDLADQVTGEDTTTIRGNVPPKGGTRHDEGIDGRGPPHLGQGFTG